MATKIMASSESLAFARLSFQDAREEIRQRIGFREKLVEVYVVGSITLVVALVAARQYGVPAEIYFLPSVFSLITALQIRAHVETVEKLANFIRWELNPFFIANNGWAPSWDWHTRSGKIEKQKTFMRSSAQIVAIHVPSIISFLIFTYAISTEIPKTVMTIFVWSLTIAFLLIALETSRQTYKIRNDGKIPETPDFWKKVRK